MTILYQLLITFCAVALGMNLMSIFVYPDKWVVYGIWAAVSFLCVIVNWSGLFRGLK